MFIAGAGAVGRVGRPGLSGNGARRPSFDVDFVGSGSLGAGAVFTRASVGTYYNSSGVLVSAAINTPRFDYDPQTLQLKGLLLEDASTNVVFPSSGFGGGWSPSGVTFVTGQAGAPDGTSTFTRFVETAANANHYVFIGITGISAGVSSTFSVYARAQQNRYLQLSFDDATGNGMFATFDLQAGIVSGPLSPLGSVTLGAASVQPIGGGTYRCSISGAISTAAIRPIIIMTNTANPGWLPTYTGNTANGLLVWGAQVEALPYMSSHIPTTSVSVTRAADALYYPIPSAVPGYNAANYSLFFEFDTLDVSKVVGGIASVFGDAGYFSNSTWNMVGASSSPSGVPFITAGAINKECSSVAPTRLAISNNGGAITATGNGAPAQTAATKLVVGSAPWQPGAGASIFGHMRRISYWPRTLSDSEMIAATTLAGPTLSLDFMQPGTLDPRIVFSRASSATYTDASGVIQTAATNAPRWDYANGVLRGLLIEEARTNLWLQSADASNAAWGKSGNAGAPVVTGNQVVAPDGTTTAARVVYPAVGAGQYSNLSQSPTLTVSPYAFSIWLRGNVGGERLYLNATGDAVTYYRQQCVLTTAWQRFTLITPSIGTVFWQIGADLRDASQTATSAQTIYVWGADLQQGAFPTSYIPTTSVSVTRAADVATMPTNVSWFAPPGGSWFAEFIDLTNAGVFVTNSGRVIGEANVSGGRSPMIDTVNGGVGSWDGVAFFGSGGSAPLGSVIKGATTWAVGRGSACINGGVVGTAATQTQGFGSFTTTGIKFMQPSPIPGDNITGYLRRVTYWNRALSDIEMQQVTT